MLITSILQQRKNIFHNFIGILNELEHAARDYVGLSLSLSRDGHYVYHDKAITAREIYVESIFLSKRLRGNVDEANTAEETMSSNRLPLVIRILVVAALIWRTKHTLNVCARVEVDAEQERKEEKMREREINRSVYPTCTRTDGRERKR